MSRLFFKLGKSQDAPRARPSRWMAIEQMESRQLMTINPLFGAAMPNVPAELASIRSEGNIGLDASNGTVTVNGTDHTADRVTISYNNKGTATLADDTLNISVTNIGDPVSAEYRLASVQRVVVSTYAMNDTIDNQSSTPLTAYAGAGDDVVFGGSGDDILFGGVGNDYLDGRRGSDTIGGDEGYDALFGDEGIDLLLGGSEDDRLFGGNGDDYLYGEAGNDSLYGEAGLDKLTDPSGTNKLYADYGPNYSVSSTNYNAFDWFDKNLSDPTLRSAARFDFKDGLLDRADMLQLYTVISTDGYVSTQELADLKAMLGGSLNFQTDTKFFASMIANGDAANMHYHGNTLGHLTVGSADRLNKLVDKWFKGGDMPAIAQANVTYRAVNGSLFQNGVSYEDVDQGATSDCYLMCTAGAIALHSPSTINNMFAENGDGTWTVKFVHGDAAAYVTVNRMLPVSYKYAVNAGWGHIWNESSDLGRTYDDPANELWVPLLEKAYAQLNESNWIGQDGTNSYAGIEGGQSAVAFGHLAGHSGTETYLDNQRIYTNPFGRIEIITTPPTGILQAINAGQAVTLSTFDNPENSQLVGGHCYDVIGYNASTGKFRVFNPWGISANTDKPIYLELSWSDILNNCKRYTTVQL